MCKSAGEKRTGGILKVGIQVWCQHSACDRSEAGKQLRQANKQKAQGQRNSNP